LATALIAGLETAFAIALLAMAIWDIAYRRLPNWLNIAIAVAYLPYALALGLAWTHIAGSLAVGAAVLAFGIGLFSYGLIGGGDVKLAAAISIWIGPSLDLLRFFLLMALVGGVLALVALGWEKLTGRASERALPYGVALAVSGLEYWLRHNHVIGYVIGAA
jgi:prepilin peptidase CpaA